MYYVPEFKNNLLSVGQLQEKGLTILIKEGKCIVYHSERGHIIEVKMKENQIFVLTTTMISTKSCFLADLKHNYELWHNRLGHLSYNGLRMLSSKKLVNGLPSITTTISLLQ